MLVLTRRANEKIIIGNRLVNITLLHIGKMSVRIGIDAPKELSVHREEIYDKIMLNLPPSQAPSPAQVTLAVEQLNLIVTQKRKENEGNKDDNS